MVSLWTLAEAALALSSVVNAAHPPVVRQSETLNGDLISTRDIQNANSASNATVNKAKSSPIVLAPLRGINGKITKRDTAAALAPTSNETLYWGGQDGTVAQLDILTPASNESILNTEWLDGLVNKLTCPQNGTGKLIINFINQTDVNDAHQVWQWVNEQPDNHFTVVVGAGDCGWNTDRVVYNATNLISTGGNQTVTFSVQRTTWKQAMHSYDLTIGNAAKQNAVAAAGGQYRKRSIFGDIGSAVSSVGSDISNTASSVGNDVVNGAKKAGSDIASGAKQAGSDVVSGAKQAGSDIVSGAKQVGSDVANATASALSVNEDPSFSIPLSSNLTNKGLSFSSSGIGISATCSKCTSGGSIEIEAKFSARLFQIQEAFIEATTQGLNATALFAVTVTADITSQLASDQITLFSFSPLGISIPDVLTIGPDVSFNLGAQIGAISGGVTVSFGGTVEIPPSTARLDFLSQANTTSNGWKPTFQPEPFSVAAFIQAKATIFLSTAVGVELSALGTGYSADLTLQMPALTGTLKALTSPTCTACGDFGDGVQGTLSLGTNIGVTLNDLVSGTKKALFSLTFINTQLPQIAGFCKGFGPSGPACLGTVSNTTTASNITARRFV